MEARVAFYFRMDTESLSDEEIAYKHSQIEYILTTDFKDTGVKLF